MSYSWPCEFPINHSQYRRKSRYDILQGRPGRVMSIERDKDVFEQLRFQDEEVAEMFRLGFVGENGRAGYEEWLRRQFSPPKD